MSEFFQGWRRKTGCVALVIASVLTAGWIRSEREIDYFAFTDNGWLHIILQSASGTLTVFVDSLNSPPTTYWWSVPIMEPAEAIDPLKEGDGVEIDWRSDWGGFSAGSYHVMDKSGIIRTGVCLVPYWSIVLPITLVSAYLILVPGKRAKLRGTGGTANCDPN